MPVTSRRSASFAAFAVAAATFGSLLATPLPTVAATSATTPPVSVGVVVPLSVPGGSDGLISSEDLAAYTAPDGLLARELDAVSGTPVAIGIDPMIIASIRLLGNSAPDSALAWLAELEQVSNDTFALTYADSDLTVALQAGSKQVLAPTSFDFAIDSSLFSTDAPETPDPANTAQPDPTTAPPLPTSETLLEWDYTLGAVAWPRPGTVATTDLPILEEAGYATTILSEANVSRASDGRASASMSSLGVAVTDDELSDLFATTIHTTEADDWERQITLLSRGFADLPDRSGGASVILALDRNAFTTATRLRETVNALDALASAEVVEFGDLVAEPSTTARLVDSPQSEERIKLMRSMLVAEKADAAFATVANTPELITGERRIRLLGATVPNWGRYTGTWRDEVADFVSESRELRRSVHVATSSDLIFGDRGFIPISVANSLDQPVTVVISVRPLSPLVTVEDESFELEIEPDSQRVARIPAVSRSNGEVDLRVSIESGSDVQIGSTTFVRMKVQAGWETPVTIGLGIAVFGLFVFGIVRSIRRRRKASKEGDPAELPVTDLEDDE